MDMVSVSTRCIERIQGGVSGCSGLALGFLEGGGTFVSAPARTVGCPCGVAQPGLKDDNSGMRSPTDALGVVTLSVKGGSLTGDPKFLRILLYEGCLLVFCGEHTLL